MAEHCTQCGGTGKTPNSDLACLHCAGVGIEPKKAKPKSIGPFHTYPGFGKHLAITIGLIIVWLLLGGPSALLGG